jgi:hypothetical protein
MLKIFLIAMLMLGTAFSATGTLNLIFANGDIVTDDAGSYYCFDVQIWLSEGDEALSSGMVYVDYPASIFGNMVVYNGNVDVEKAGILNSQFPDQILEVYDVITNDTYNNCFAVTFDAFYAGNADMRQFYGNVSTNPAEPSDLMRISIRVQDPGSGQVFFPSYIAGIEDLYWNFDYETFNGGLIYSEAVEDVYVPEEAPVGSVEIKSISADWKKTDIIVKWMTRTEVDIVGYRLKRSSDGNNYTMIASYENDPSLIAQSGNGIMKYEYKDSDVAAGNYIYQLEAVDISGYAIAFDPVIVGDASAFELAQSYPNPFNPSFTVPFRLEKELRVDIKLYDMSGKVVRNIAEGTYSAGDYAFTVLCDDLGSGVYILSADIAGKHQTQKMLLVK